MTEILQHAKTSLKSFSTWFEGKVEPFSAASHPSEFSGWRKELQQIRDLIENPDRVRIALVGTTGAGKSTLLNAVLGQQILPVGVMQPCTAFVTSVRYSQTQDYRVRVQFYSRQEWRADLENLAAFLQPGEESDPGDGRGESRRFIDAARKRIEAVFGENYDELPNPDELLGKKLPQEVERVFRSGSEEKLSFVEAADMLTYLRKLIRGESCLWPLIKQVSLEGPYKCLEGGIELVDLPGLNDPNEARVEATREFLRTSPFVWVVFAMVRGLTEDIQRILREEKVLRKLVFSGTYDNLSLVGTKADEVDTNNAPQLGLPDDCSTQELIHAFREQTVTEVKKQLEQMVRDLALGEEGNDTLKRMVGVARKVRVHTTSANAYIKIRQIAPLRKDYGIQEERQTGIPLIHKHFTEIGKVAGAVYNAETAITRLRQLSEEIAFFFRAKAQAPNPAVENARTKLQQEREAFASTIHGTQKEANTALKLYREQFLGALGPLLARSVQGVRQVAEGWEATHWATLKAIVQRDGSFKSPTTGRFYDLNEDLAEPLLGQLPLSWEKYFTDDLGRITNEFILKLTESGKNFCGRVRLIIELLFNRKDDKRVEEQLAWFQDKVALLAKEATGRVTAAVRERRSELAAKMPFVAKSRMQPAYNSSKVESGTGMKKRILGILKPTAIDSAQPIYSTIQSDLVEGLNDLEMIVTGMFRDLSQAAEEQTRIVVHNANIDVDDAAIDPVIANLLETVPRMT